MKDHVRELREENDVLKSEYAQLNNELGNLRKQNRNLQNQLDEIDDAFEGRVGKNDFLIDFL